MVAPHCHIKQDVLHRSRNQSALARLGYQRCARFSDDFGRHADYRGDIGWHRGTAILLPSGANPEFADPNEFLMMAINAETRKDAQEGRTFDIALPRGVPPGFELAVGAWTLAPLAAMGMPTEIDAERPVASDGGENPHLHIYINQRELGTNGLGNKCRAWNTFFRRNGGKYVRCLIASRLMAACALIGVASHVDPRPKRLRSDELPEERLSEKLWHMRSRGVLVERIEEMRQSRAAGKVVGQDAPRERAAAIGDAVTIENSAEGDLTLWQRSDQIGRFAEAAARLGFIAIRGDAPDPGEHVVDDGEGGCVYFDGKTIVAPNPRVSGGLPEKFCALLRMIDWPAIVIDGDPGFCDAVTIAGAPVGLMPINRPVSAAVLARISDPTGQTLLRDIEPYDPLGAAAAVMQKYRAARQSESTVPEIGEGRLVVTEFDVPPVDGGIDAPPVWYADEFPTMAPKIESAVEVKLRRQARAAVDLELAKQRAWNDDLLGMIERLRFAYEKDGHDPEPRS